VSDPVVELEHDVSVSLFAALALLDPKLFPDEFATGQWLW
jgi:hypothetical protein